MRNEIKTERNETKRSEAEWNETKSNETEPIETRRNKTESNETKSGKIFDIFRLEKEQCSMKI